jgi:DNA-3-methyladenine glycosylase I
MKRCEWPRNELAIRYHDEVWGEPVHDDRRHFEFLLLGGAQAGLSWNAILKRRDAYRAAFDQFDPALVAEYRDRDLERLLADEGIVRNRQKVTSAIQNARAFVSLVQEFGAFDAYLWRFVDGRPIVNAWRDTREVPSRSSVSDELSKDLKGRRFSFVGSTICYAFMQTVGLVNDHLIDCFRYSELSNGATVKSQALKVRKTTPEPSVGRRKSE